MSFPRISIARLMWAIFLVAIAITALSRPNRFWAAVAFGTTLVLLIRGSIRLFSSGGFDRDYWRGFCLAGWAGFVVHFGPFHSFGGHANPQQMASTFPVNHPSLFVLDLIHDAGQRAGIVHRTVTQTNPSIPVAEPGIAVQLVVTTSSHWFDTVWASISPSTLGVFGAGEHPTFIQIGYALLTLVFACAGGWYGRKCGRVLGVEEK